MALSQIRAQLGALSDALAPAALTRTAATIAGPGVATNAAPVSLATLVAAVQTLIALHIDLVTAIAPALPVVDVIGAPAPAAVATAPVVTGNPAAQPT